MNFNDDFGTIEGITTPLGLELYTFNVGPGIMIADSYFNPCLTDDNRKSFYGQCRSRSACIERAV